MNEFGLFYRLPLRLVKIIDAAVEYSDEQAVAIVDKMRLHYKGQNWTLL